jgi:hypothetical protein
MAKRSRRSSSTSSVFVIGDDYAVEPAAEMPFGAESDGITPVVHCGGYGAGDRHLRTPVSGVAG